MKVRDLIKCVGYEPVPTNSNDSRVNQGLTHKIYADNTQFFINANTTTTFPVLEETNLDDDEITDVLSFLLKLQDEYFGSSLPLADELCKKFVWNMPREVYKLFKDSIDYDTPDALNIMTLFYAFCMKDLTRTGMCKFINKLCSMIREDDMCYDESNDEHIDESDNDIIPYDYDIIPYDYLVEST